MALLTNSGEGGSNSTAVTAANSGGASGSAWAADPELNSGAITFSNAQTVRGGSSLSYAVASSSTGRCMVWWTPTASNLGAVRFYVRFTGFPSSSALRLCSFTNAGNSAVRMSLAVNSTGNLIVQDSASATQWTSSATMSTGTWYRIEASCDNSGGTTAGAAVVKTYTGANLDAASGETAGLSTTLSAKNFGSGTIAQVNFGRASTGSGVTWATFYLDDLAYRDGSTTLIGPGPDGTGLVGTGIPSAEAVGLGTMSGGAAPAGGVLLTNNAEGQASGTAATVSNTGASSGTPLEVVTGTGGSFTFSNAQAQKGSQSYAVTSGTGSNCYVYWTFATAGNAAAARCYVYLTGLPAAATELVRFSSAGGGTRYAALGVNTSGALIMVNAAGAASSPTAGTLALNTWYRIEVGVANGTGTADTATVRTYTGANIDAAVASGLHTANLSLALTGQNYGTATLARVNFGRATNGSGAWATFYLDDLAAIDSTASLIGPSVPLFALQGVAIDSDETVGNGTVGFAGTVALTGVGIPSAEAVGLGRVTGLGFNGAYEDFYSDTYGSFQEANLSMSGFGITSGEAFGLGTVTNGTVAPPIAPDSTVPLFRVWLGLDSQSNSFTLDSATEGVLGTGALADDQGFVWVDVSEWVLLDTVEFGRGSGRTQPPWWRYEGGRLSFRLDNIDGRFDPTNVGGPYWPDLRPSLPVRVTIDVPPEYPTETIWTGVVDSWGLEQNSTTWSSVPVSCCDIVERLQADDRPELPSPVGEGDSPIQRLNRILDRVGLPNERRDFQGSGMTTLQATSLAQSAWSEILLTQDSDFGSTWVDRWGRIVYRAFGALSPAPVLSFSSVAGDGGIEFDSAPFMFDKSQVINLAKIARKDSTQVVVEDQDAQATIGEVRSLNRTDLLCTSDADVTEIATAIVSQWATLQVRADQLVVNVPYDTAALQPAVWWQLATLDIGQTVRISHQTPDGRPLRRDGVVRAIGWNLGVKSAQLTVGVLQSPVAYDDVMVLGSGFLDDALVGLNTGV